MMDAGFKLEFVDAESLGAICSLVFVEKRGVGKATETSTDSGLSRFIYRS